MTTYSKCTDPDCASPLTYLDGRWVDQCYNAEHIDGTPHTAADAPEHDISVHLSIMDSPDPSWRWMATSGNHYAYAATADAARVTLVDYLATASETT